MTNETASDSNKELVGTLSFFLAVAEFLKSVNFLWQLEVPGFGSSRKALRPHKQGSKVACSWFRDKAVAGFLVYNQGTGKANRRTREQQTAEP